VVGYAGLLVVADEGYITNIAVRAEWRQRRIATQLLEVFVRFAEANRLAFLTLEVRPSNTAAILLYGRHGFREAGRRKNYYDLPKEDALIMTRYFGQNEGAEA
jgi:[ribosomal protein S18]-alanine N-acetyltransferase